MSITGRKKEIIVTAGGKNVAPAVLEDALRAHPLISQCLVVGDSKPSSVRSSPSTPEALPGWKERNGLAADTPISELVKHPEMIAEIDSAVVEGNRKVSSPEQIKKYRILEVDFTVETGELTPTLKLKRNIIPSSSRDDRADLHVNRGNDFAARMRFLPASGRSRSESRAALQRRGTQQRPGDSGVADDVESVQGPPAPQCQQQFLRRPP